MLDKSDTDIVRDWLLVALAGAATQGQTSSDLAAWCGVSPQAVNGWKRTGRITKGNLERAASFFGSGPSFTPGRTHVARETPSSGWPFPDLDRARFDALTANQKIEIQGVVRERIDQFEAMRPTRKPAVAKPVGRKKAA